jgi:serine/threonine protein phosphatase 1
VSDSPTDATVWAIGDIHGQARLLERLLDTLPRKPGDITIFLGDYLDRGLDSREVVERVLAEYDRAPEHTVLLWGNHEAAAAGYFGQPNPFGWQPSGPVWPSNSFLPTLRSFGLSPTFGEPDPCPPSLVRLFGLLRTFWRCPYPALEHVIFVHAGVPPGRQPEDTSPRDLLGIRAEFTQVIDPSGRLVVFGHTWSKTVFQRPDKIGIDTGAGHGGPLSALELPALRLYKAYPDGSTQSHPLLTPEQMRF